MPSLTDTLNAAVAEAVREIVARPLAEKCKAEVAEAQRLHIRSMAALLRAKALGEELAGLGVVIGTEQFSVTEADLIATATAAVRSGLLSADDPVLAGIPRGA